MEIKAEEISQIIRKQIEEYDQKVSVVETGTVLTVGDGIARVYGLAGAMAGELLEFPHDVRGIVLNLEEDNVGVALLGEYERIRENDVVYIPAGMRHSLSNLGSEAFEIFEIYAPAGRQFDLVEDAQSTKS